MPALNRLLVMFTVVALTWVAPARADESGRDRPAETQKEPAKSAADRAASKPKIDAKSECAEAYESAQEQRADGRLRLARQNLMVCSQQECPEFIRKDCGKWSADLETSVPTVVLSARDEAGKDLADVSVSFDGTLLVAELDGRAVIVDPGKHSFVFEHPGHEPVQRALIIQQGQKNRLVEVQFKLSPKPESGPVTAEQQPKTASSRTLPRTLAYVLGGVGAAGLVSFGVLGLIGKSEQNSLEDDPCKRTRTCSEEDVDSIRTKYLVADISLAVGVLSLGAAAYVWFQSEPVNEVHGSFRRPLARPKHSRGRTNLDVKLRPESAFATLSASF